MEAAQIAELLEPYLGPANDQRLTTDDLIDISTYIDMLQRWNAHVNLTAIRNEEEIVTRHFGESLFAARHLFPSRSHAGRAAPGCPAEQSSASTPLSSHNQRSTPRNDEHRGRAALQGRVIGQNGYEALAPVLPSGERLQNWNTEQRKKVSLADVGSGAGFPGIPIKLWAPEISLTLIESNHKKAAFLREVARALTLTDIDIKNTRAESLAGRFDVVTLRAVERFETVLPVAASLVALDGRLALLIGSDQIPGATSTLSTLKWAEPLPVPLSRSRMLLVGQNQNS